MITTGAPAPAPVAGIMHSLSYIAQYDVANPAAPTLLREICMDGEQITTRMTSGGLHLVMRANSRIPTVLYSIDPDGEHVTYETEEQYCARVARQFGVLPVYASRSAGEQTWRAGDLTPAQLYGADDTQPPALLNVITIDDSGNVTAAAISDNWAYGSVVYASEHSVYVADNEWWRAGSSITRFDLTNAGPQFAAACEIDGQIMGQFAMDQGADGTLRVTLHHNQDNTNALVILQKQGTDLVTVGSTVSFAQGETIQSVRYIDDMAFVVTFRRVDPLFAIDLSNPADPTIKGELVVPGFSGYLHPVSRNRLIGFGRAEDLRTPQLSLYDASDSADPRLLSTLAAR